MATSFDANPDTAGGLTMLVGSVVERYVGRMFGVGCEVGLLALLFSSSGRRPLVESRLAGWLEGHAIVFG